MTDQQRLTAPENQAESDRHLLKLAALEELRALNEARQRILDEHSHSFRWLTASLLAINGGASVAILANETLHPQAKALAGLFFTIGILFALLIGVISQRANQRCIPIIQERIGYWLAVSQDGERVEKLEESYQDRFNSVLKIGQFAQMLGWVAAIMFCVGAVSIGVSFVSSKEIRVGQSACDGRDR